MMYKRVITPSAKRSLKKLPLQIRKDIIGATEILEHNPCTGKQLSGSLCFLYSFHFKCSNVAYRVAYTIDLKNKLIVIHLAGTRENFYEKLSRLFK